MKVMHAHIHSCTRTHTRVRMHTQMTCNVVDSGASSTPGKGCVYSFDPVGSYERETYRAGGSSASMLQPLLDNQVSLLNVYNYM